MNEERSLEILNQFKNYNKFFEDLKFVMTFEVKESINIAIETMSTHYEKQNSIIKNAINYIQYNNKELKNYSEQEMLDWLYGLDKCCEIKEEN